MPTPRLALLDAVGVAVPLDLFKFPGGEWHVRLQPPARVATGVFHVRAHLINTDTLMQLLLLVNAVRSTFGGHVPITLHCPYVPYARQDRVAVAGEAHSLSVIVGLLQQLQLERITIADPHSHVTTGLLQHGTRMSVTVETQTALLEGVWKSGVFHADDRVQLVAPDAGALAKTQVAATYWASRSATVLSEPLACYKQRDPKTGDISGVRIADVSRVRVEATHFLLVDDICDGGRTFTELAAHMRQTLKQDLPISLYVTHGIFSQGLQVLKPHFQHVFCPYPFPAVQDAPDPFFKRIDICA